MPTRASLLTGRTPHNCGAGVITELATGFPGYNNVFPKSCGTIARILRDNGYATAMFGKNHNTPGPDTSAAGPFNQWPTGLGFDYFWGFNGGDTSQWEPNLIENTRVYEETPGEKGRHLSELIADHAIGWIAQQKSIAPQRPFFAYIAPGATHAPHHVPREWIDRFKGQFDMGWDKYRELAFARQLKLGVVPKGTKLTPRPAELRAWDSLSPDEKRVASRMMEVFAGYTAHTDYEMGRVIDYLEKSGQRDNTLIFYIVGDNGASGEGTVLGSLNEVATFNGLPSDTKANLAALDELGGPKHFNHFPSGWSWAMTTPFQWMKQVASHFGGTRNPLVVSWPKGITAAGGLRSQFHHVSDIAPTILEATGIAAPQSIDGFAQKPLDGISMAYTFNGKAARSPDRRQRQIFEMFVNRAIYDRGWVAASMYAAPWAGPQSRSPEDTRWELYNVDKDFSEANDLAAKEPARLKSMVDLWYAEAAKGQILPLDTRRAERFVTARPNWGAGRQHYVLGPETRELPAAVGPRVNNRAWAIDAGIDEAGNGVVVAQGGRDGGWSLHVENGAPVFSYNMLGITTYRIASGAVLKPGANRIQTEFVPDGPGFGRGGTLSIIVNGAPAGSGRIERTIPLLFPLDGFDVGDDRGQPVTDYPGGAAFTGRIAQVAIDLK